MINKADRGTALRVLVAVLTWNDFENTEDCVQMLQGRSAGHMDIDTVVINNGSDRDVSARLRASAVKNGFVLTENDANYGYAEGYCRGLARHSLIDYDVVVLLNNDTLLGRDQLAGLCEEFLATRADIASPYITTTGSPAILWGGVGVLVPVLDIPVVYRKNAVVQNEDFSRFPDRASFVSGCCLFVKPEAWSTLGGLDGGFFYSVEDVDFSRRARSAGMVIRALKSAQVLHKASASSGGWLSRFSVEHFVYGRGLLARKKKSEGKYASSFLQTCFDLFGYVPNRAMRVQNKRRFPSEIAVLVQIYFGARRPVVPGIDL